MEKKSKFEKPDFDKVVEINEKIKFGNDPVDFDDKKRTIPEIINHVSYEVDTLSKPLVILSQQAYGADEDPIAKYYRQLSILIGQYNLTIFDQYTEYYVDRYINQVLQNVQATVKKVLDDNELPSYNIDLYNAIKDFHKRAHEIFIENICVYRLNTIEGMAAEYVKDLAIAKNEEIAITGMDMIRQIFSPYLHTIVVTTVFELYNTVMKYIYNNLLYETTVESAASINLAKMNIIEQQLTPVFNATTMFLMNNYSNMILNCFFSRTNQDHSIESYKDYDIIDSGSF